MMHSSASPDIPSSWVPVAPGHALYFTPLRFLPQANADAFGLSPDQRLFDAVVATHTASASTAAPVMPSCLNCENAIAAARFFSLDPHIEYKSLNADFGPVDLACFVRCFHALEKQRRTQQEQQQQPAPPLVVVCSPSCYSVHNAACVVAAYAVVVLHEDPNAVKAAFAATTQRAGLPAFLPFRDAGIGPSSWDLSVDDVVDAFVLARRHRWFPSDWAAFDADAFARLADVDPGVSVIVPGMFVASAAPRDDSDVRDVLLPAFTALSVRLVARLTAPDETAYSDAGFTRHGISTWAPPPSAPLRDGQLPPDAVVRAFFDACNTVFDNFACGPPTAQEDDVGIDAGAYQSEALKKKGRSDALLFKQQRKNAGTTVKKKTVPGCVAVHCRAGLGRTGTLIAMFLMHRFQCRARETIAWLRLCRPGSVLGPQQSYLVAAESRLLLSHISLTPPSNLLAKVVPRARQALPAETLDAVLQRSGSVAQRGVSPQSDAYGAVANAAMLHPRPATGTLRGASSRVTTQRMRDRSVAEADLRQPPPLPELRAQSSLSFHDAATASGAGGARATTTVLTASGGVSSLAALHRSSTAAGEQPHARTATPFASAVAQAARAGCTAAPFGSFRVPWASPLTPTVQNEDKAAAYRTLAALTTSQSRKLPRTKRGHVLRFFGSAADEAAAQTDEAPRSTPDAPDQQLHQRAGLQALLASAGRTSRMFSPVPLL